LRVGDEQTDRCRVGGEEGAGVFNCSREQTVGAAHPVGARVGGVVPSIDAIAAANGIYPKPLLNLLLE
jgi:hypothetical protein